VVPKRRGRKKGSKNKNKMVDEKERSEADS
jgi:hypothetical protein